LAIPVGELRPIADAHLNRGQGPPVFASICIPSSVEKLSLSRNASCVSVVAFEYGSRVSCLGDRAFFCSSLSSICIPSSVERLGRRCFFAGGRLSAVTFEYGSQLSFIDRHAFEVCISLRSIHLPLHLEEINYSALPEDLGRISIADGNDRFAVSGDWLLGAESTKIITFVGDAEEVTIPAAIKTLGGGCFARRARLSRVRFEPGGQLSDIGPYVFSQCKSLLSIWIPSSVKDLGKSCFMESEHLSIVTFETGSNLSCIERKTFHGCSALASICIPSSVTRLCRQCFGRCSTLSRVTFESPSNLSSIEEKAFAMCSFLSSICIPSSLKELHYRCFEECRSLLAVTFESGSSLSYVAKSPFAKCANLSAIYIPSSLQFELGQYRRLLRIKPEGEQVQKPNF
jgi:hypothetical protein